MRLHRTAKLVAQHQRLLRRHNIPNRKSPAANVRLGSYLLSSHGPTLSRDSHVV